MRRRRARASAAACSSPARPASARRGSSRTPSSRRASPPTRAPRDRRSPSPTRRSRRSCANACADRLACLEACGPLAPYLAPLLPELGMPAQDAGEAALVEALRRAFAEAGARGPAAILLDDLHWADEATLALLPELAGGLRDVPMLLVAIARDEVPADTHRLRRLRAHLRRECDLLELPLRPFDREDTARLAATVAGEELDDDVIDALHERTHGIPFYVEELAATIALRRTARTPAGCRCPRRVLDAVLLRTEALSLAGAQRAREGGRGRAALRDPACRGARRRRADRGAGSGLPRRCRARAASSSGTRSCATPSTRRSRGRAGARCTRRVARALERAGAPAAERATQWLGAGDVERARAALAEAAAASCGLFAYRDAADPLRTGARSRRRRGADALRAARATRRLRRARRRSRDLRARLARGDRRAPRPRRGRAGRRGRARDRPRARAARQHRAGPRRVVRGRRRLRRLRAARGRRALPSRRRARAAGRRQPAAGARRGRGGAGRASRPARRPSCARVPARSRGSSLGKLGETRAGAGSRCTTRWRRRSRPGHAGDRRRRLPGARGRVRERRRASARRPRPTRSRSTTARRPASPETGAICSACLCHVLRQRGEWRRSLALGRSLLDDPSVDEASRAIAAAVMSQIHASRGERRPARLRVMEAAPVIRQLRVFGAEMECSWTLARLELLEGSDEAALEHCRDVLRRWEESEDRHYSLNALGWSAGVFAALGQDEDLNRVVRALASIAAENGNREALAMLARALGELARVGGRCRRRPSSTSGRRSSCTARSSCRTTAPSSSSAPPRPRATPASTSRRANGSRDARLQARRLGARPLQATAEQRARRARRLRARARPRPPASRRGSYRSSGAWPRAARTARSRPSCTCRVRTVDMHVRHSLIALGCRSRMDAARKAAGLGLLEPA